MLPNFWNFNSHYIIIASFGGRHSRRVAYVIVGTLAKDIERPSVITSDLD